MIDPGTLLIRSAFDVIFAAAIGATVAASSAAPADPATGMPEASGVLRVAPAQGWSLAAGSVVFESHGEDRVNIHRYDAGAAAPVALTSHRATDMRPRWAPDGNRVAFSSDIEGSNDIFLVNADGTGLRRITDDPASDTDPDWMPDGKLLFSSDRDGDENLFLLDLKSGDLRQLTFFEGGRAGGPSAAPDGRRVVFSTNHVFSWQVYVLELANGAIERITGPLPGRCNPAWNPADGRIAYMAGGDLLGTDLRSITPAGEDSRSLGSGAGENKDPQFSEDGTRMVWVSDRDGNWEIYEGAADGANEKRVSPTPADERHPDLYLGTGR